MRLRVEEQMESGIGTVRPMGGVDGKPPDAEDGIQGDGRLASPGSLRHYGGGGVGRGGGVQGK